jgi:hypothetical protein
VCVREALPPFRWDSFANGIQVNGTILGPTTTFVTAIFQQEPQAATLTAVKQDARPEELSASTQGVRVPRVRGSPPRGLDGCGARMRAAVDGNIREGYRCASRRLSDNASRSL